MKKQFAMLACLAVVLTACEESATVRTIKGGYHYKTSGQVTVSEAGQSDKLMTLNNESGQMEVVSLYDDDKVLLTFNQTNGAVYNTRATMGEDKLTFDPFKRTLPLSFETVRYDTIHIESALGTLSRDTVITHTSYETETFEVEVSGRAEVYENTLIFYLNYDGKSQQSDKTLRGKDIQTLAKKNG